MKRPIAGGRFVLERMAGRGGMGTVYQARERDREGWVAVKLLDGSAAAARARFTRECELLSRLVHPRVVRYVAHGEAEPGQLYLAMEWLEGEDLASRLTRGPLHIDETLVLASAMASGLSAAHAEGIIHRDIKPSNLFLVDGRIDALKILDFGVARRENATTWATAAGQPIGTPGYMSPEQARGDPNVDGRSDLFSVGCVLHECLAGTAPFEGENLIATLTRILFSPPDALLEKRPETPPALADLVGRLLEKDPDRRPVSAAEIAAALARTTPPPDRNDPTERLGHTERRRLFIVIARRVVTEATDATLPALPDSSPQASPVRSVTSRLAALADDHGASIERLLDGSIVAVVDGQSGASDAARRAARLALELRSVTGSAPLALATGTAVVGGGLPWRTVIDRAVALSEMGGPQGICVDENTVGLLDARFEVADETGCPLLLGERERPLLGRRLLGRPSPFVGREREIRTLLGTLAECHEDSVARVALVTAAAGLGKSRLLAEVLGRARSDHETLEVWTATADPLRGGSPFGLLTNLVRNAANVRGGDPAEVQIATLRRHLATLVGPEDLDRIATFLVEMCGIADGDSGHPLLAAARRDPRLMGDRIREAFVDFVTAQTRCTTLLVAIDDMHWGDLPSINCIDDCLRRLSDRPIFVLALARPEVHDTFPRLWPARNVLELRLPELGARPRERLVRSMLGEDAEDALVQRVAALSGGNAFYLEELIRAVVAGERDLPESVLAMAQVRYEGLDARARAILRAASIFGMISWTDAVARLLGEAPEVVAAIVSGLVDDELLERKTSSRFAGEDELEFRHALLREAAYAALTEEDRELGHRLAGMWLREANERDAILLAEHFERGGEPKEAARWYCRAAEQALEGDDLATAENRARRAFACGAEGEDLERLYLVDVTCARWRGEYSEVGARGESYLGRLRPGSGAWLELLGAMLVGNRIDVSLEALAPVQPQEGTEAAFLVTAARAVTQWAIRGIGVAEPLDLLRRLRELAPDPSAIEPGIAGWVYEADAFTAAADHRLQDALDGLALAREAFERAGDRRNALAQQTNFTYALMEANALDEAEVEASKTQAQARELGLQAVQGMLQEIETCIAAWRTSDPNVLAGVVQRFTPGSGPIRRVEPVGLVTLSLVRCDELDRAEALARATARDLERQGRELRPVKVLLALVAVARRDYETALRELQGLPRRLIALCAPVGLSGTVASITRAEAHYGIGDHERARQELEILLGELWRTFDNLREPIKTSFTRRHDVVRARELARLCGLEAPG